MVAKFECDRKTSIQELLDWAKESIQHQAELKFQSPALESRLLFSHATGYGHAWLITHSKEAIENNVSSEKLNVFINSVEQRLSGKPIAYVLGSQSFWSLNLKVSDCTLIPRQDTETLIEAVLALTLPEKARVLDLGTGTGAIALALAKEKSDWQVCGVDTIQEAVALAKENALLNALNVNFMQSNWFSAFDSNNRFDLIVTNPPYVEQDSEYLLQGDLRFEPLSALVSGKDGLDDIRLIISQSRQFLAPLAYLVIEHGIHQCNNVQALLCDAGFTDVKSIEDLNHIPRITLGRWPKSM